MSVRTPPRPPFEHTPRACALCGTPPEGRRRSWCSDWCVELWFIATSGDAAHKHLVRLHGRTCWGCAAAGPDVVLEVEHVRPLWSLTDAERLELRWWLPFNLQLLCVPCHRAKTRAEAAQRAAVRAGRPWPPAPAEQLVLV